jgi:hypothetical protein
MSAATEVEDKSERNRLQGIINGSHISSGRQAKISIHSGISMNKMTTLRLFRWPINKFGRPVQSLVEYFGYRDKNTTISVTGNVAPA